MIYKKLPELFFSCVEREKYQQNPTLLHWNTKLANALGIKTNEGHVQKYSGYKKREETPLAMAYAGHQFGHWAGRLGDGRALLIEQRQDKEGNWQDIHLKGSGRTPYSRMGDGKAVLRSSIREYLCSEAMRALNIPTTRALALCSTHEDVQRETIEQGALITRIAQSHIRFGHFEYASAMKNREAIKALADHVIEYYMPAYKNDYTAWFHEVVSRTAYMIAQWQSIGFCHGVMNTDNMSILGLTLDYGPFGFMEEYDPQHICNHSDYEGRYSFENQPQIGLWNLYALANSLQHIIPHKEIEQSLGAYHHFFDNKYAQIMRQKLGFQKDDSDKDVLWQNLLRLMQENKSDYTLSFRNLNTLYDQDEKWLSLFKDQEGAKTWRINFIKAHNKCKKEEVLNNLNQNNPKYILRNWLAEEAIRAAEDHQDMSVFEEVLAFTTNAFKEHKHKEKWVQPAPTQYKDLCVTCSS